MTKGIDEPFDVADVPLSMFYEVDGVIYVSGHIALDDDGYFVQGDVRAQTERVLSNIKAGLEEQGSSMDEVVKTTVFLTHAKRDFEAMNETYDTFFPNHKPARTTAGVQLAVDMLVEIEAIAVRGSAEGRG